MQTASFVFHSLCEVSSLPFLVGILFFIHRYLETNGWIVEDAIRSATEDGEWERDLMETRNSNHIEIKVVNGEFTAKGAGLKNQKPERLKMMLYSDGMPAIATKTVRPQDVYNVSFVILFGLT